MSVVLRVERDHIEALDFSPQSATGLGTRMGSGPTSFRLGNVHLALAASLSRAASAAGSTMDSVSAPKFIAAECPDFPSPGRCVPLHTVVVGNALESVSPPENRANAEMYLRFDITRTCNVDGWLLSSLAP